MMQQSVVKQLKDLSANRLGMNNSDIDAYARVVVRRLLQESQEDLTGMFGKYLPSEAELTINLVRVRLAVFNSMVGLIADPGMACTGSEFHQMFKVNPHASGAKE